MKGGKKNKYKIIDDYAIIYLERRSGEIFETYIDLEDLDSVINFGYCWHAGLSNTNGDYYAQACQYLGIVNGKDQHRTILLHRFVTDMLEETVWIDHLNHNSLDNRKKNLRITTNKNNTRHRNSKNSNNKSGYRNVCWLKDCSKWCVQLQIDGKNKRLGFFDDVDEAGKFAEEMRQKYYKEYAGKS